SLSSRAANARASGGFEPAQSLSLRLIVNLGARNSSFKCCETCADVSQEITRFLLGGYPIGQISSSRFISLLCDEERRHGRKQQRDEGDPEHDHDAAQYAAPCRVRNDVAVADGAEGDYGPPDPISESWEIFAIHQRCDKAGEDGRCGNRPGQIGN